MPEHQPYMQRAVQLARLAGPAVATNPMVGAVLVHQGRVVGEGYHQRYGGPHAEVHAIAATPAELLPHCTLYVSLEPCSHHGKTPPCASLIVRSQIPHVVIGQKDPNPLVNGNGIAWLQKAGIRVTVLEDAESEALLYPFVVQQHYQRPYTTLKWAETADGYMGLPDSRLQITSVQAMRYTHRLRARHQAILIGGRTYHTDQPRLNTRAYPGASPTVLLLQRSTLGVANSFEAPLWELNAEKDETLAENHRLLSVPYSADGADLHAVMQRLYKEGIGTLMVEGGSRLLHSLLAAQLWDELHILRAPHRLNRQLSNTIPSPQVDVPLQQLPLPGRDSLFFYQKERRTV